MTLTTAPLLSSSQLQAAARNNPPIRLGSRGEGVAILQRVLADLGYPLPLSIGVKGSPDGIFGNETLGAVRSFQGENSLTPDGVVGELTSHQIDATIARGWFSNQLHLGEGVAFLIEEALRSQWLPRNYPELTSPLRHANHELCQILGRYDKAPRRVAFGFEQGPGDRTNASAQAIPVAAILALGMLVTMAAVQAIAAAQTKAKPPRIPDFPKPDIKSDISVNGAVVIAIAAAALLVMKTALEKLRDQAAEIGKKLRECLQQAKSPQCQKAIEIALNLQKTLMAGAQHVLQSIALMGQLGAQRVAKDATERLQRQLEFLREAIDGLSRTGCCPGILGK